MTLEPFQIPSKKTNPVPKAAHMSYTIVGLITNFALTFPVQVNFCSVQMTIGPSSPFCGGDAYFQWSQIVQDGYHLKYGVLLIYKSLKYSGNSDFYVSKQSQADSYK